MALSEQQQGDWSAGLYRARQGLPNGAYDLVNCLIDDDGYAYRRGGSANYSASDAPANLVTPYTAYLRAPAAERVLAITTGNAMQVLDGSLNPVALATATNSRPVSVGDYLLFPQGGGTFQAYGGSLKGGSYITGTVTVTAGSPTVTGSGTSWTANVDPGMLFTAGFTGVVKTVTSNTSLTLTAPWPGSTASGQSYAASTMSAFQPGLPLDGTTSYLAVAGSGTPRLLMSIGNRIYASNAGDPLTFDVNTYVEVPVSAQIVGLEGYGDSALVFTTEGVWRIDNLSLSPVDAAGNQQWVESQINKSVVLWGDLGIASWNGQLIVPATDNIYLMSASGATEPIGAAFHGNGIGPLLRSYVASGYKPGRATTFEGHYFLPIVSSNVTQDVLVCRLDRPYLLSTRPRIWGYPWTRWAGSAAGTGFAVLPATASAGPKLFGVGGKRVTDLTGTLSPTASNSQDADGTTSNVTIITRDYPTQDGIVQATVARTRAKYVLTSDGTHTAPTLALAVSSDADADSYTTLTDSGLQGGGTAGATSDGSKYSWWRVTRRRDRIRFKITVSGASASFTWRVFELLIRPTGKR